MKWCGLFLGLLVMTNLGCGSGGGRIGDANDPTKTSDVTAMQDETGSIGQATNGKAPKKK